MSLKTRIRAFIVVAATAWPLDSRAQQAEGQGPDEGLPARNQQVGEPKWKHSSFTFVRIRYSARRQFDTWTIDYPDADLSFAARFQKVTGLAVQTNGLVLELTDPRLRQYPFIYIVEGGQMVLRPEEVTSLRQYLLGGGFLMVDDFWGEREWEQLRTEMKRVFPEREAVDLPLTHRLFHCYYDLKEKPQVPNIGLGTASLDPKSPHYGHTWERLDAREAHYRGLFDDRGQLMAVFCHNTDLGDGWEREKVDERYYREFSLKKAYPMGINIVVHALSQK